MSKEQVQPSEPFEFTEREILWDKLSDSRFRVLLDDPQTTIHKVEVESNDYGEFLFITVNRPEERRQQVLTFYGYGFHEYRERWFTDEWAWYRANPFPKMMEQNLTSEEAEELLAARREEIAPNLAATQTKRGRLFEIIADLTDDDGAISELEDLGDLWDDLADNLQLY